MEEKDMKETFDFDKALADNGLLDECRDYRDIKEAIGILNDYEDGEDDVECCECHMMMPESDCKYEQSRGYICHECQEAIKAKGEQLVFEEDHKRCHGHDCDELNEKTGRDPDLTKDKKAYAYYINQKLSEWNQTYSTKTVEEFKQEILDAIAPAMNTSKKRQFLVDVMRKKSNIDLLMLCTNAALAASPDTQLRRFKTESKDVPIEDCPVNDVITHSEDEKPLDCKMEKKPLEKPLTEAKTYVCEFDGRELGTVEANNEEEAQELMMNKWPEYAYGAYDGIAQVYELNEDIGPHNPEWETIQADEDPAVLEYEDQQELMKEIGDAEMEPEHDEEIHGYELYYPVMEQEVIDYCDANEIGYDNDGRMTAFFSTIAKLKELHDKFFEDYEFTIDGELYLTDEERMEAELAMNAANWQDVDWDTVDDFEDLHEDVVEGDYKRIVVTSDGLDAEDVFPAYSNGALWNGWECPFFEKRIADRVMEMSNNNNIDSHMRYDADTDAYYLLDYNYEEDGEERIDGVDIDTEEGTKHAYPIGAWSWTWVQADETQIARAIVDESLNEQLSLSDMSLLDRLVGQEFEHNKFGRGVVKSIEDGLMTVEINDAERKLSALFCLEHDLIRFTDPEIAAYVNDVIKSNLTSTEATAVEPETEEEPEAPRDLVAEAEAKAEKDFANGDFEKQVKLEKQYIKNNETVDMLKDEVEAAKAYLAKIEELKATKKGENSAVNKIDNIIQTTSDVDLGDENVANYIKDITFMIPDLSDEADIGKKQAVRLRSKLAKLKSSLEARFPGITASEHFKSVSKKENNPAWYNNWGISGYVKFNRPVGELPESIQNMISIYTKISQDNTKNPATMTRDVSASTTEIHNVYLAFALLNCLDDWREIDHKEEDPFDLF